MTWLRIAFPSQAHVNPTRPIPHDFNHLGQPIGWVVPTWKAAPFPRCEPLDGRFYRLEALDAARHGKSLWEVNTLDAEGRNWTYLPYGPFSSFDDYYRWIEETLRDPTTLFYALIDRSTGQPGVVAAYLNIDPANGAIEIGHLAYSPLLQRKPAATEAMFLMIERAFSLGYRRTVWKCNLLNAASRAAAERLGFSFEGIFRNAVIQNGRSRDTAWYSITEAEWPALQTGFLRWLDPANFDATGRQKERLSVRR